MPIFPNDIEFSISYIIARKKSHINEIESLGIHFSIMV